MAVRPSSVVLFVLRLLESSRGHFRSHMYLFKYAHSVMKSILRVAPRPSTRTQRTTLLLFSVLLLSSLASRLAAPEFLHEQSLSYHWSFLLGASIGFYFLIAFMGFDLEESTKLGLASGTINIDPKPEENRTEIKVAGLGLGRTGSTSLAKALEILGYWAVHDYEQTKLTDLFMAEDREEIDTDDFHRILGLRGYNATFKTADFRWVARHPEVKAILTVRDNPDQYVDSWLAAAPFVKIIEKRPFCWMRTVKEIFPSLYEEYRMETTGRNPDDFLNGDVLKKTYVDYIQKVQDAIPAERLLTFNVKQGWQPLCEFLGEPIPVGIPFPHVHTRARLEGEHFIFQLITYIWPLAFLVSIAIVTSFLKRIFDKKRKQLINHTMVAVTALVFLYLMSLETTLEYWEEEEDDDEQD